jgi:outer membrane receptor protein involved in Fe transport
VNPVDPLVRTYGAEFGVRTLAVDRLQSTVSLWWLNLDSELLFVGDAGTTEATRPSRRYGVEFANYYTPTDWLTLDADFSWSHARFRDRDPAGDFIPGAIETVVAAGVVVHDVPQLGGFFAGLRLRYFGSRPLIEDDSVRSGETILLNAQAGYRFSPDWALTVDVFNVLDRQDDDITYLYESQLAGEAAPVNDLHFHPVEPVSFRVAVTGRF